MREILWIVVSGALLLYAVSLAMTGQASVALGLIVLGIVVAGHGIKNRMYKLVCLVGCALALTFAWHMFNGMLWTTAIIGVAAVGGVLYNDFKEKGKGNISR